jgi:hypothetical protein
MQIDWITLVSGLPRSGTSLMMQMLSAGGIPPLTDGLRAADDDNPAGYFELERIQQLATDSSWLNEARGRSIKIISLLLYDLPPGLPCRILFMQRNLDEILASQRIMLQRRNVVDPGPADDPMRRHFENHLVKVQRWINDRQIPCLKCDYNRLVQNPDPILTDISAFLDGHPDPAAMRQVIRPDLYRNKKGT